MTEKPDLSKAKPVTEANYQVINTQQAYLNLNNTAQNIDLTDKAAGDQTQEQNVSSTISVQEINAVNNLNGQLVQSDTKAIVISNQAEQKSEEIKSSDNFISNKINYLKLPEMNLKIMRVDQIFDGLSEKSMLHQIQIQGEVIYLNFDWIDRYILVRFAKNSVAESLVEVQKKIVINSKVYTPRWA
ncbi:MAG: hypothetical protein EZS28_028316, partial [Streblomastix strix]